MSAGAESTSELDRDAPDSVFVMSPIGPADSPIRRRSDRLFTGVIEKVLDDYDLVAVRSDKLNRPGSITVQIVHEIVGSRFVVADLARMNPNVFYELGIADAFGINSIIITDDLAELPFDVKDQRTIELGDIDGRIDVLDAAACCEQLSRHVSEVLVPGSQTLSVVELAGVQANFDAINEGFATSDDPDLRDIARMMRRFENYLMATEDYGGASRPLRPTQDDRELEEILRQHSLWLATDGREGIRADLSNRNLSFVHLEQADLSRANLRWTNLASSSLSECVFVDADLTRAHLERADLETCDFTDADLSKTSFKLGRLVNCRFVNANLSATSLRESEATGSNFESCTLVKANLRWTNLSGADLTRANLTSADLSAANLDEVTLAGATFDNDTKWPEGTNPAELGARPLA